MRKNEAIKLLAEHKNKLVQEFGVIDLALFGSTSRDTAGSESDIDILVIFDGPATSSSYFGLQFYLEDMFSAPVDLVTSYHP